MHSISGSKELQALFSEAKSIVANSKTPSDLFGELIRTFKLWTSIKCIQLLVVNRNTGDIEVKHYSYSGNQEMYDIAHKDGIIDESIKRKEFICLNSTDQDPKYDAYDTTIRSELVVPILIEGEVYGVINFEHNKENIFSNNFVKTIVDICEYIANKLKKHKDIHSLKKERVT